MPLIRDLFWKHKRLRDEIEAATFAQKQSELRSKETQLQTRVEGQGRQQSEWGELAVKVFGLSQTMTSKWLAADIAEKRLLLEIICLNWTLDGVKLVPEMRKPFDLLAEGLLISSGRENKTSFELFWEGAVGLASDLAVFEAFDQSGERQETRLFADLGQIRSGGAKR